MVYIKSDALFSGGLNQHFKEHKCILEYMTNFPDQKSAFSVTTLYCSCTFSKDCSIYIAKKLFMEMLKVCIME